MFVLMIQSKHPNDYGAWRFYTTTLFQSYDEATAWATRNHCDDDVTVFTLDIAG